MVPRIDRPPRMPRRGLSVFCAIASPPGMEISTSISVGPPTLRAASSRLSRIIWRGAGLMAGSPGGRGSPARVTVPTPSPARKVTPVPGMPARIVAITRAPCVTSGSSPASLTIPALAPPSKGSAIAREKAGRAPPGSAISTRSGKSPVRHPRYAALAAAVAQAPVVQPRRSGPAGLLSSMRSLTTSL